MPKKIQPETLYIDIKKLLSVAFTIAETQQKVIFLYESYQHPKRYYCTTSNRHKLGERIGSVYPQKWNKYTGKREATAHILGAVITHEKYKTHVYPERQLACAIQARNCEKIIAKKWPELLGKKT